MVSSHVPPHLAEPKLTYVSKPDSDTFLAAAVRGFHEDYVAERWEPQRKVLEPDRNFGFTVGGRWVATCGAYGRTMAVPGGTVAAAAVTMVTVAPPFRRRGLLTEMMRHQLRDIAERGREPVALLWASESAIYGRFGYGNAVPRLRLSGSTRATGFRAGFALSPGAVDEVSREMYLVHAPDLRSALLRRRPGALERSTEWWDAVLHDPEHERHGTSAVRYALHFDLSGEVDGYATFRVKPDFDGAGPQGEVQVLELESDHPATYAALWRYLLDLDLVRKFSKHGAPVDEPLRYLVEDARAVQAQLTDSTYVRIIDVPRALEARSYNGELDVVLHVHDSLLPVNDNLFRLHASPAGTTVTRTDDQPDLTLGIRELGASYLGGTPLSALFRAGLVEERTPGVVSNVTAAFASSPAPFCQDFF